MVEWWWQCGEDSVMIVVGRDEGVEDTVWRQVGWWWG
jgi:hypothetical protein